MTVDADTKKHLDEVKKGKPRRFVMICKGGKIQSIIVYKKGTVEKYKKQAKEDSKGQFYHGVVSGKGLDITFCLQRSDGFEAPPGKDLLLKEFLKSEADLKCQPSYAIVDELPAVPFDEDDQRDPLIARFIAMEPSIAQAREAYADSTPLIDQRYKSIYGMLQEEQTRVNAGPALDEFVQFLDSLSKGDSVTTASAQSPSGTPAPPPPVDLAKAQAEKLAQVLKKLKPVMDKVVSAEPDRKVELHTIFARIAGEIKSNQLDLAKQELIELGTLLKPQDARASAAPAEPAVEQREFTERRQVLESQMLEAKQKLPPEKLAKLAAVLNYATQQAQANDYGNALKALERLQVALTGLMVPTDAEQPPGIEEPWELLPEFETHWKRAKSVWQTSIDTINEQLENLRSHLLTSSDSDLKSIAEFGLNAITDNHRVPLQKSLLNVDHTLGRERIDAIDKAQDAVFAFIEHIERDERVEACDNNPFGVTVTLRSELNRGLTALRDVLDEALV
jgi:hypothetical protein